MIISENWLREWVDSGLTTDELAESLTMAGLEVDGITPVAREFSGIIVAEVRQVTQHPDADKLRVCSVFDGEHEQQVVCGAPNVVPGMKAPFATVGATIEAGQSKTLKITKAKLRGVESHGMLCSAEELGLEESSEGLMELPSDAPVGQNFRVYLQLSDSMIELDLTPNRGDCLGMRGIAREVGVLSRKEVREPAVKAVEPVHAEGFPVTISETEACPRYLGRLIRNVKLECPFAAVDAGKAQALGAAQH